MKRITIGVFSALPTRSVIAVCTNGVLSSEKGKEIFREGFETMNQWLEPKKVIIVGREIELQEQKYNKPEIVYMKSFGQRMVKHGT